MGAMSPRPAASPWAVSDQAAALRRTSCDIHRRTMGKETRPDLPQSTSSLVQQDEAWTAFLVQLHGIASSKSPWFDQPRDARSGVRCRWPPPGSARPQSRGRRVSAATPCLPDSPWLLLLGPPPDDATMGKLADMPCKGRAQVLSDVCVLADLDCRTRSS
jgi:hypothetical protein